ncbi:MAG: gamma-carboxymuconolactone decarboxylase [Acetobacteraceae bacterium]|nr:gamma-carboxymuconolactone decarboxylase [Acetobacteraceae bacterium]MSP30806.1 gamma-carboxymuconolactone decarboxylase [Acetobacteraceae bacterium]
MAKKLDARRQDLKVNFTQARGYWSALWDDILELSPDYFEAYTDLSSVPWRTGPLEPKVKEFVYIAVDSATTHLYNTGTGIHIANALRHGASRDEVMEVLMIASVLGIHTMTDSLPIMMDVLKAAGKDPKLSAKKLSARQQEIKAEFTKNRGFFPPVFEPILHFSPDFMQAYTDLSSVPWKMGVLEPKVRELLYVAIDASTTHLYNAGTRTHMTNAVKYGATVEEIMEVLMLTASIGVHTMTESVPILMEEHRKFVAAQKKAPKGLKTAAAGKAGLKIPARKPANGKTANGLTGAGA